jgi:large subunit ribosomal protein L7/L12
MSKISQIVEELKSLSLLEASELVKLIEETFGVSAAAPVAVASVAGPAGAAAPAAEEQTEFDVVVDSVPADKKIAVIKIVKDKKGVGLSEAKALVEGAPFTLSEKVNKEEATKLKEELSGAGAIVSLK